jgi:hypothetical protein
MAAAVGCSDSESPPVNGLDTDPPVVTGVTAIDYGHLEVEFDEVVDKNTAEWRNHYTVVEQGAMQSLRRPLSPGDTLEVGGAVLQPGGTTVVLTLWDVMHDASYNIYVHGVKDVYGNGMTNMQSHGFTGTAAEDITAPELIARTPSAGQTGVGLSQSVIVQFSEQLDQYLLYSGFYWTGGGGNVEFTLHQMEGNRYVFSPAHSLALNTLYTVGFNANTVTDWGGNYLAATSWSFRTTNTADLIRPTVTATSPEAGDTNVPLDANLSIEFSEPIDPTSMEDEGVLLSPDPGQGLPTWSNGNRKLTFDPDNPLLANTTYNLLIPPGAVRDLAGNPLDGGENVIFTTGSALPAGSFSGMVTGDATSPEAADPAGAFVVAFLVSIEDFDDYDDGPPHAGSCIVNASGNYTAANLADNVYFPLGMLDSNNDGRINPELGDAIGVYGVDFYQLDFSVDSVTISGGASASGIDFAMFDPVTIAGTVSYGGTNHGGSLAYYPYYVGAFSAATFDTSQGMPEPDFTTYGDPIASEPYYILSQFDDRMVPGSWYVGAYMDVNDNQTYDPGIDPIGFHMDGDEFGEVTVENGHDELDIDIIMVDPVSGAGFSAASWQVSADPPQDAPVVRGLLSPALKAALQQVMDRSR